ncbi:MAG TPA: glutamine--fructose-6-phosphate transaminase (isomerizing) [Syntrophorhabdaceae bacterium]|nr:glutamine--fructose-6-phosphate transaminase (isomerizing) [Syntrophorhabdaceae bacterium]HQE80718.1 glutamine--fructose-6-phosphate transaminase (isomerizing) [Syntrophorhabdaceae bacterium]HQH42316.1 glutamine--fructose-6-phosphate transaminase (isomerizing) [Syntrophorhabdaceae bacterium]HQK45535.1 glutamine--fructose-6-phosphate transaminase (isomerizing) [Syntrophorhabdaceae bacterium]HRV22838.1 glutamine--fructose-6-phosphate transaminase (isomerizing) [Syntrophorhabdaceae bacterium]
MCGIVGYQGRNEAFSILIDALKKLEYRGYDSAGIAIWHDKSIEIIRRKGKVDDLRKAASENKIKGTMGLAHTRWATHGIPSERNAHPHRAGDVVVVHNGIIENYMEIKEQLKKQGHRFTSDTDTEVIPHLINSYIEKGEGFIDAVRLAIRGLEGSYALGIMRQKERIMIAVKKESPLIVGVVDGESVFASDAPAIIDMTNKIIFLEDNDIVVFKDGGFRIMDIDGNEINRKVHTVNWTGAMAQKGGFKHFMLKEIYEQPRAITETLIGRVREEKAEVDLDELKLPDMKDIKKIWMVACGTSYHACLIGKYIFESSLRIPVETDIASEFRYREPIMGRHDMLILVSQSGETADTIAAMKEGKKNGVYTLSICNVLGSTLSRESDGVIFTHAGPEIGVASTKAFTTQITVLFMLMLHMGRLLGVLDKENVREKIVELKKIPHKIQSILNDAQKIEEMARRFMTYKNFLYLGRGINYPSMMEGALKLKEISYIHAEAYAAGEMKHGPIALIDENLPVVVLSPHDRTYQKTCSNIEEVFARRGKVMLITDIYDHEMSGRADSILVIPSTIYELQPLLSAVPLQLLAYNIANLLGTDVDQPRNLAKSVTVE